MRRKVHNHDRKCAYRNDDRNVRDGREVSDTFRITNCVKQGWVLAPTLYKAWYKQCSKRFSETVSTSNRARMQNSLKSHTLERKLKPQIYLLLLWDNWYSQTKAHRLSSQQRFVGVFSTSASRFCLKIYIWKGYVPSELYNGQLYPDI